MYKRQKVRLQAVCLSTCHIVEDTAKLRQLLQFVFYLSQNDFLILIRCTVEYHLSVSYTHLDVYKRQIIDPHHIPYVIVDKDTYGKMDGATVMKMALIARKKADMQK